MVGKMSKAQIFASNVKKAFEQSRKQFFNFKKDGFEYRFPLKSLLPPNRVPEVAFSTVELSSRKFPRVDWL
jgi:threonyl-tRNA synthetase